MKTASIIAAAKNLLIPYWGRMFTQDQVYRLFKNEEFKLVKDKTGAPYMGVQVSESKKWLLINHRFYPIPLIALFFPDLNIFCMIDGSFINLEVSMNKGIAASQVTFVKKLFGPQAYRDGFNPKVTIPVDQYGDPVEWHKEFWYQRAFIQVEKKLKEQRQPLALCDWKQLRYDWERLMADMDYTTYRNSKEKELYYKALRRKNNAFTAMNNAVLDERSITAIADSIEEGTTKSFDDMLDFDSYQDPLYVCNCVRVLKELPSEKRVAGIKFLMDCMKDIDEPYYDMASDLLMEFPQKMIIPVLESSFHAALENEDVLRIAGLMALSKRLNYELA